MLKYQIFHYEGVLVCVPSNEPNNEPEVKLVDVLVPFIGEDWVKFDSDYECDKCGLPLFDSVEDCIKYIKEHSYRGKFHFIPIYEY